MAPSTVFSYLRRDHRRPVSPAPPQSPPPLSPASPSYVPTTSPNPPQLPVTAPSLTLTDSLLGTGLWKESEQRRQSQTGTECGGGGFGPRKSAEREVPTVSLRSPSPEGRSPRPHSGVESNATRCEPSGYQAQSPVFPPPENNNDKPISPWRLTFGNAQKGIGYGQGLSKGNKGSSDVVALSPGGANTRPSMVDGMSSLSLSSKRDGGQDESAIPFHSRSGKTKLNLLNPLALLARRRSNQLLGSRSEEVAINRLGLPALPDDYDPRIRGKVVHDFSVPRPRSNVSVSHRQVRQQHQEQQQQQQQQRQQQEPHQQFQPPTIEQELSVGNDRLEGRNELESVSTAHLTPKSSEGMVVDNRSALPEQSGRSFVLPGSPPPSWGLPPMVTLEEDAPATGELLELAAETPSSTTEGTPQAHSNAPSRHSTTRDPTTHAASGLPRHLYSTASRFSFDMGGVESSSQERLLEEKHKEKEAARKANLPISHYSDDSDTDDLDYAAMMEDDGLEERIPGVNYEADDDELYDDDGGISGHSHPNPGRFVPVLSPVLSNPTSPRTLHFPSQSNAGGSPLAAANGMRPPPLRTLQGTADSQVSTNTPPVVPPQPQPSLPPNPKTSEQLVDDDFYYDGGMLDDVDDNIDAGEFDESIFDDESSHLYERKQKRPSPLPAVPEHRPSATEDDLSNAQDDGTDDEKPVPAHGHGQPARNPQFCPGGGLTEGNLKAYHSALAHAANEAALKGRFERSSDSGSETFGEEGDTSQTAESHPGLTADDSRVSRNVDSAVFDDAFDDFDYDDSAAMDDDDAIIAAANAEVLEYDDEGFYGQEFGFYSHSHVPGEGEPVYGGFFGPRRVEGLTRNHSGRANFREPSLTPITERSEWSTRNSIISLTAHQSPHSNAAFASPPLAQLMDMGNLDDDMSLTALIKLRRSAFGGSNGSLRSSAADQTPGPQHGSLNGSPMGVHDTDPNQPKSGILGSPGGSGEMTSFQSDSEASPLPQARKLSASSYANIPVGRADGSPGRGADLHRP